MWQLQGIATWGRPTLQHMKGHSSSFSDKKNGSWGWPLLLEIVGQTDPVGAETPIFNRYSLTAPQP